MSRPHEFVLLKDSAWWRPNQIASHGSSRPGSGSLLDPSPSVRARAVEGDPVLVRVTCSCKKSWFVDDSLAGTQAACKSCGGSVTVPGQASSPSGSAGAVPPEAAWSVPAAAPYPTAPASPNGPWPAAGESFLAYQTTSGLGGEKRLYRVYREGGALAFLRLGAFVDGVDYSALIRSISQAGTAPPEVSRAELRFRARLAAVEAMTDRERVLEAAKSPNHLVSAAKLTQVRVDAAEGFLGPWATDAHGYSRARLQFRVGGRPMQVELRDPADVRLAVHWLWELLGPRAVSITFPVDAPPAAPVHPRAGGYGHPLAPAVPVAGGYPTAVPGPPSTAPRSAWQTWGGIASGAVVLGVLTFGRSGCNVGPAVNPPPYVAANAFPELGPATEIRLENTVLPASLSKPGSVARFNEVVLNRGGRRTRLWIYRPGTVSAGKLPCVLIAPAGTRLFHGMELGDGDKPEHAPYVRAGMVVVAYELDGSAPESAWVTDPAMVRAASEFMASEAGLRNGQDALNYALARVPEVDPYRVFAAGHSSAATAALNFAQHEPRIKGVAAYAPCTDVEGRLGDEILGTLDGRVKGFRRFIQATSPVKNAGALRCPAFLFHAEDDNNVPITETEAFVAEVRKTNPSVTFHRVPRGGHYNSMLENGVPQAISWMLQFPHVQNWQPVPIGLFGLNGIPEKLARLARG